MNLNNICGICLITGAKSFNLKKYPHLGQYYKSITGLQSPQEFCFECTSLIIKYNEFRDKCIRGLTVLNKLHSITQNLNMPSKKLLVDRSHYNLTSPLGYCTLYACNIVEDDDIPPEEAYTFEVEGLDVENEVVIEEVNTDQTNQIDHTYYTNVKLEDDIKQELIETTIPPATLKFINKCKDNVTVKPKKEILISKSNQELVLSSPKTYEAVDEQGEMSFQTYTENIISNDHGTGKAEFEKLFNEIYEFEATEQTITESTFEVKSLDSFDGTEVAEEQVDYCVTEMDDDGDGDGDGDGDASRSIEAEDGKKHKWNCLFVTLSDEEIAADIEKKKRSEQYVTSAYKCELCFSPFRLESTLLSHMKFHDEGRGGFECCWCKRRYKKSFDMQFHVKYAHRIKVYCLLCPFEGVSNSAREHYKKHLNMVTYTCKYCKKDFEKRTTYLSHLRVYHPNEAMCASCGASFMGENGLILHYSRSPCKPPATEASTPFQKELYCQMCKMQFTNRLAFSEHLKNSPNHDISQKLQTGASRKLRQQIGKRKRGGEEFSATCTVCNERFDARTALVKHCQQLHQGRGYNKRAVCELCGANIVAYSMSAHMARHNGQVYKCDMCDKTFTFKRNLVRHFRVQIHNDERRYQCEYCNYKFHQKCSMEEHVKHVHLGVPYRKRNRPKKTAKPEDTSELDKRRKWYYV